MQVSTTAGALLLPLCAQVRAARLAALFLLAGFAPDGDLARARALLTDAPVIDGHNDVPWKIREQRNARLDGFTFDRLSDAERLVWHTDIARMREGRVGGQFWSVYVDPALAGDEAVRMTLEQIDIARRLVDKHAALAFAPTEIEAGRAMKAGRIASMLGAEGGHSIGNSMGALRRFHDLGVGYMTLTHNKTTDWADSATDAPRHDGLSPFGVEVVREMNRLGMLVDLSHVAPSTMHDAIDVSAAPAIFSHSSARSVTDHPRNVPDDVLIRLPTNGGVVMVTFVALFTSTAYMAWRSEQLAEDSRLAAIFPGDASARRRGSERWAAAHPAPAVTIAQVADHIDRIREVAGIDHIGLGADLDGTVHVIDGLSTAAGYPQLFAELLRRGYSAGDLRKIAQGNVRRVMKQAGAVAVALQRTQPPSEARLNDADA